VSILASGLSFQQKCDVARNLLRRAIREQLARSLECGSIERGADTDLVAEELLATVTRPGLATALQVLSTAHAGEPSA
jgi:hypothetical protein